MAATVWRGARCVTAAHLLLVVLLLAAAATAQRNKDKTAAVTPAAEGEEEAPAEKEASTGPPLTGNPQIDYVHDPNLPHELNGFDLSEYPFFKRPPKDGHNFTCDGRHDGFYASIPHMCQVYYNCLYGQRYDFLCANYTMFDQVNFICHYASEVDCAHSERYFSRNEELYVTTTTTTPAPQIIYVDRPSRPRPQRPRPINNRRPQRPFRRRRPSPPLVATTTPKPQDDVQYYDYYDYNYDDYYYDDTPQATTTTTTTSTTPIPVVRRPNRPGGNRGGGGQGGGRRRGGGGPRRRQRPRGDGTGGPRRRLRTSTTTPAPPEYYDDYYYDDYNDSKNQPQASQPEEPQPRAPVRDTPSRPAEQQTRSKLAQRRKISFRKPQSAADSSAASPAETPAEATILPAEIKAVANAASRTSERKVSQRVFTRPVNSEGNVATDQTSRSDSPGPQDPVKSEAGVDNPAVAVNSRSNPSNTGSDLFERRRRLQSSRNRFSPNEATTAAPAEVETPEERQRGRSPGFGFGGRRP